MLPEPEWNVELERFDRRLVVHTQSPTFGDTIQTWNILQPATDDWHPCRLWPLARTLSSECKVGVSGTESCGSAQGGARTLLDRSRTAPTKSKSILCEYYRRVNTTLFGIFLIMQTCVGMWPHDN